MVIQHIRAWVLDILECVCVCVWVNPTSALSPLWQTQCHRNVLGRLVQCLDNSLSVCEWQRVARGHRGGVILGRRHARMHAHMHRHAHTLKREDSALFLSLCAISHSLSPWRRETQSFSHSVSFDAEEKHKTTAPSLTLSLFLFLGICVCACANCRLYN